MKALQVIESAYRCTIEEQDDPAIWITHAMKGAGGEFGVLLRGNAVNYAVQGQDASGLIFGGREQTHPPQIDNDIRSLMDKGIDVYFIKEDANDRGIGTDALISGVKPVSRGKLPEIFADYDQIWHW